jgi:hypothetical protein
MFGINPLSKFIFIIFFVFTISLVGMTVRAQSEIILSKGQTVYIPVYSHIYFGDKETPFYLAATLSIRNTDQNSPITIYEADYYDSQGKLIKRYIEKPIQLNALFSTRFVVKETEDIGGSGANFIVKWKSDRPVNMPIIESVMIGTKSHQGISFTSRGQAIK